jgi:hypothetical protein
MLPPGGCSRSDTATSREDGKKRSMMTISCHEKHTTGPLCADFALRVPTLRIVLLSVGTLFAIFSRLIDNPCDNCVYVFIEG